MEENDVWANEEGGVVIAEASALIARNTLRAQGKGAGWELGGLVRENEVAEVLGIVVGAMAAPTLRHNTISGCEAGVFFVDGSAELENDVPRTARTMRSRW